MFRDAIDERGAYKPALKSSGADTARAIYIRPEQLENNLGDNRLT
jgi:hypothetical protein